MYVILEPFGYNIYGETIGSVWLSSVEAIIKNGIITEDEGRKRLSLQNIRIKSETQSFPDPFISKYGNKKNVDEIINLTFNNDIMHDFDIVPSFDPGSKSYHARLKDWNMIDFVVERLAEIPESKKAVMSFIREEDYQKVLKTPKDDYLPCITTIQFRLIRINNDKGYHMNTLFNARSIDVFQKFSGNLVAISLLSKEVAKKLSKRLNTNVWVGPLDGFLTDVHIYEETIKDAKEIIKLYKQYDKNIG
ncbi:MAG: thymidylate synthase [Candidatus Nealsonbacteria bacterium]